MKATEKKSTAQAPAVQQEGPLLQQGRQGHCYAAICIRQFFSVTGDHHSSGGMVQTKLTVNEPGDSYEKEADAVADKVVQRMAEPAGNIPSIQTKCDHCEEEEKVQKKEDEPEVPRKIQRKPTFDTNAGPVPGSVAIRPGQVRWNSITIFGE